MMTPKEQHDALSKFFSTCHEVLEANMHKGGWDRCDPSILLTRVHEEIVEVEWELHKLSDPNKNFELDKLMRECCDVANITMMVWDQCRRIDEFNAVGDPTAPFEIER